jgi:hypothetical protein
MHDEALFSLSHAAPPMDTVPSGHNTWAELLTVVGIVRRLAFARNLPPTEALGRIRDAFQDYDQHGHQWASDVTPAS